MAFASRTKFYWSRFFATCVRYLGVANTQHIRYITEKIFPTEMSRQNILYHVRIAEEKGWLATFSSSLEMTDENQTLFRSKFLKEKYLNFMCANLFGKMDQDVLERSALHSFWTLIESRNIF